MAALSHDTGGPDVAERSHVEKDGKGTLKGLPFHHLANLFPLIEGAEFEELVRDIKANGLRDKIVLHDDMILDGRNRYRACLAAKLFKPSTKYTDHPKEAYKPYFVVLPRTTDPLTFVISKNLKRRHLSDDQRRMLAARIATLGRGRPEDNAANGGISRAEAARIVNVDEAGTERAKTVVSRGTVELQAAVDEGRVTVRTAAEVAVLPQETQEAMLARLPRDESGRPTKDAKKIIRELAKQFRSEDQKVNRERRLDRMGRIADGNRPLPVGAKFGVIRADVATTFKTFSEETGAEKAPPYPTLTLEQLIDMGPQVGAIAANNAVLILDTTVPQLAEAFYIAEAWGFHTFRPRGSDGSLLRDNHGKLPAVPSRAGRYVSHQVWHKLYPGDQHGTGYRFWNVHELVLMFVRGDVPKPIEGTQERSLFEAPVGEHSEKPEYINEWIERYFERVPKIELFRRGSARPGWAAWGNQAELPAHDAETGEIIEPVSPTASTMFAPKSNGGKRVADFIVRYIADYVHPNLADAENVERLLRTFILPKLGKKFLKQVQTEEAGRVAVFYRGPGRRLRYRSITKDRREAIDAWRNFLKWVQANAVPTGEVVGVDHGDVDHGAAGAGPAADALCACCQPMPLDFWAGDLLRASLTVPVEVAA